MKKLTLLLALTMLICFRGAAQYTSITPLKSIPVSTDTKDKPQSKLWFHGGKYWTVLTQDNGTFLWRLDSTSWTNVLKLSTSGYGRADCKTMGDVTHILLFRGVSSHLVSVEYIPQEGTYKLWSANPGRVPIALDPEVETATIDIDAHGRMWLASDAARKINVRWSDAPYTTWSAPITLANGLDNDDICTIVNLPATGLIGVFWSNQNGKTFGFRTHQAGSSPTNWSDDELPASQSAQNIDNGIADDHINVAAAADGTLYCAVKTGYESQGLPKIALLVRRPTGTWDNLYEVTREGGTRPIVLINEETNRLKVIYTASETGGNILYKETSLKRIAFAKEFTLMEGQLNFATSMKQNYRTTTVILTSRKTEPGSQTSTEVLSIKAVDPPYTPIVQREELVAYPNPFIEKTKLSFYLPETGPYSITLQDLTGNFLAKLREGHLQADELQTLELDGSKLSCGIYIVKMQTNRGLKISRLVLAR